MTTESVADLKRQLEFGNAVVQARAFTALIGIISDKSEAAKSERILAVEQLWNCLKCEKIQLAGWASTAVLSFVRQGILLKDDAVRQSIHVLSSAHHPRIAIDTIGNLIAADKTRISNPTHPLLTIVYQHPNAIATLISYLDAEMGTQNAARQSAIIPLLVRLAIGKELADVEKQYLEEVIARSSSDSTDLLVTVWLWSSKANRCRQLSLLARDLDRSDHVSILLEAQCSYEQLDFSSITDKTAVDLIDSLALARALSMGPIDQTIRLLAIPAVQRIVKERRHGALLLPALLQMYSITNDLASIGLTTADEMKTLKLAIASLGSSKEELISKKISDDQRPLTESQSVMQQLHLLSNSMNTVTAWLRYWVSTGVACASTSSVHSIAFLLSVCKDVASMTLCCKLLTKFASFDPSLSNCVFPLVLQQYAKETDPVVKSVVLATIPKLATHRLCTAPILKFLLALCQQPNTRVEAIGLLGDLWERHERLFSQFQELLTKGIAGDRSDWASAKVQLMRKICRQGGDDFGEDLLPVLSGIVNQPPSPDNAYTTSEAVMAISDLCRLEVIELPATWKQLWSKLRKDDRHEMQIALCHLLSVASIETEEPPDEAFVLVAISQLWQLGNMANNLIKSAAFEALSKFNSHLFTLKMLPAVAKTRVKLPASMATNAEDVKPDPDDVLDYIPGFCFIDLLDSLPQPARPGYEKLMKAVIRTEVVDFGRSVYHVKPAVSSLRKSVSPLVEVERNLSKLYMDGNQEDVKSILAVACLHGDDLMETSARSAESAKRHAFVSGRKYLELFARLLSDIRVDANDWRRCISILSGWHQFVRNMFEALISARCAELEMDPTRRADLPKRISTAWMWARDQIVESMKRAAAESTSAQLNTILALASLVTVVHQYNETVAEAPSTDIGPYVSHGQWLIAAAETLLSNAWPEYKMKARLLFADGILSNPSALMSSFASVAACAVMPLIMDEVRSFLGPIDELFAAYLRRRTAGELSTVEALCLPLALGLVDSNVIDYAEAPTPTWTIGRTLGVISQFIRRCDVPSAELLAKMEAALCVVDESPTDISIYYHLTNFIGVSSIVAQDRLEAAKREENARKLELMAALELLNASSSDVVQANALRSAFRLLHVVDGSTRTNSEKQLTAFIQRLISNGDMNVLLISAAVDGITGFAAIESSSVDKRLPEDYSSLPESSVLRAVVDKLSQADVDTDTVELLVKCLLDKFREDGRSLPPLDWHLLLSRWVQHEQLQPLLIRLAVQERSVSLAVSLMTQERLSSMKADTVLVLASQLASSVSFVSTAHLQRAFKHCFASAGSDGDDAVLGHLWTAIATGLSFADDKASETWKKSARQMALDWLDMWINALPAIDNEAVSAFPIFVSFGDVGKYLDEWDLKKRLKRLEYDSVSACMWLHCQLLKSGHWQLCSARSLVELLISMTTEQRCTALLILMESARVAGTKQIEWAKRSEWLLDMMNDSLALVRGSAIDEALDSTIENLSRATLYFSVLTAMIAGWAPTTVPHGLLRGDREQLSAVNVDVNVWSIVERRFPFLLNSLLVESEFDAVAPKITEWAIDLYKSVKPNKPEQTVSIEDCLRTLLSHNPAMVSLFDRKGMWDELSFVRISQ